MRLLIFPVTLLFVLAGSGCSKKDEPRFNNDKDDLKKIVENPKDQAKEIKEGAKLPKRDPAKEALLAAERGKHRVTIAADENKALAALAKLPAQRELKAPAIAFLDIFGSYATFSPDGKYLASADDKNLIRVWDLQNAKVWRELSPHTARVTAIQFSPDGKTLISGARDKKIQFWDLEKNESAKSLTMGKPILDLAISPDGKTLAYCQEEYAAGTVGAIDTATYAVKYTIPGDNAMHIAISPSGDLLASHVYGTAWLWDARTGKEIGKLRLSSDSRAIAFSPDSWVVAVGCSGINTNMGSVVLWDLESGKDRVLTDFKGMVTEVAFFPDGKVLAAGSISGTTFLEPNTGKTLWKSDLSGIIAISPAGEVLVAGFGGYVYPTASLRKDN